MSVRARPTTVVIPWLKTIPLATSTTAHRSPTAAMMRAADGATGLNLSYSANTSTPSTIPKKTYVTRYIAYMLA